MSQAFMNISLFVFEERSEKDQEPFYFFSQYYLNSLHVIFLPLNSN